ncbi:MAG: replication-relaxation family protein [Dehalococcoidia bacterium]
MTTDPASDRKPNRLPRYKRAEKPPAMLLTERDEQIIRWVYQLRFATQDQLQQLLFSDTTASSCKRRLTLLFHNRYLDRRLLPLRSWFGANRAVYCLDKRGAELLAFRAGTGPARIGWRPVDNDRELYFLEHLLDTNEVRICVTIAAHNQGYDLVWTDERTLKSRTMRELVKDPKRPGERLAVIPDGYFQLAADGRPLGFAVELDRGTVEEKPFKTKVRALGEWKVSGAYKKRFGTDSLRVLFVVAPTDRDRRRLERIKAWTEAEGGQSLFWFAALPDLTPQSIFEAPIWHVAGRSGPVALFG